MRAHRNTSREEYWVHTYRDTCATILYYVVHLQQRQANYRIITIQWQELRHRSFSMSFSVFFVKWQCLKYKAHGLNWTCLQLHYFLSGCRISPWTVRTFPLCGSPQAMATADVLWRVPHLSNRETCFSASLSVCTVLAVELSTSPRANRRMYSRRHWIL